MESVNGDKGKQNLPESDPLMQPVPENGGVWTKSVLEEAISRLKAKKNPDGRNI